MEASEFIEPSEEEKANGWTKEALTMYIKQRESSQSSHIAIFPHAQRAETVTQHKYNPHKW